MQLMYIIINIRPSIKQPLRYIIRFGHGTERLTWRNAVREVISRESRKELTLSLTLKPNPNPPTYHLKEIQTYRHRNHSIHNLYVNYRYGGMLPLAVGDLEKNIYRALTRF